MFADREQHEKGLRIVPLNETPKESKCVSAFGAVAKRTTGTWKIVLGGGLGSRGMDQDWGGGLEHKQ